MSHRFPSLYSAVALSLVLVLSSGCSWLFMTRPPSTVEPVSCEDSYTAPIADTAIGALGAAVAIFVAAQPGYDSNHHAPQSSRAMDMDNKRVLIWEYGSVALISSLAAWRGFQNASRCTKLKSQYTLCLNGDEPSCKALGVLANRKVEKPNIETPLLQPSTP